MDILSREDVEDYLNDDDLYYYSIPKSMTIIDDSCFMGFDKLKLVNLHNDISSIRSSAFEKCSSLKEMFIPKSCSNIGNFAFSGCEALSKVDFNGPLENIGSFCFYRCSNLKEVSFLDNSLEYLGNHAFAKCFNLEKISLPDELFILNNNTFLFCKNLKTITLPTSLNQIDFNCFNGCSNLKDVYFNSGLVTISKEAFLDCSSLKSLNFPNSLRFIGENAFMNCTSLKEINLPNSIVYISAHAFHNCSSLEKVKFPISMSLITKGCFINCENLRDVIIPNSITKISALAFKDCKNLTNITIPSSITNIEKSAFEGCLNLNQITIDENIQFVGPKAFENCGFKYIYRLKDSKNIIISKTLPNDMEIESCFSIDEINKNLKDFDFSLILTKNKFEEFSHLYDKLKNKNISIPSKMFNQLLSINKLEDFIDNGTFKFLNNEIPDDIKNEIKNTTAENQYAIYKLAYVLGCFSKEKLTDKNGKKTDITVGQKASSFLGAILKNKYMDIAYFKYVFRELELDTETNHNFLNFITVRDQNKRFPNFELLLELEEENTNIFSKVMSNFNFVNELTTIIDHNGMPKKITWENAMLRFYDTSSYTNVSKEYMEMAEIFISKSVDQEAFDYACKVFTKAKNDKVENHILCKPLKEKTTVDAIENIVLDSRYIIDKNKDIIDKLYSNNFTYEMLDKSLPENAIIGVYCSCCATITNEYYGQKIAEATILANDVQNLVIKNDNDEIVAKGTLYVNEKFGYGVINDFELNEKYKAHEDKLKHGYYDNTKSPQIVADREAIFDAFMRGIKAFAKEYDKEHPDKPLQQVNVGMGFNRLSEICDKYPIDNFMLNVPKEYEFRDATKGQRILYKKDEEIVPQI